MNRCSLYDNEFLLMKSAQLNWFRSKQKWIRNLIGHWIGRLTNEIIAVLSGNLIGSNWCFTWYVKNNISVFVWLSVWVLTFNVISEVKFLVYFCRKINVLFETDVWPGRFDGKISQLNPDFLEELCKDGFFWKH